MGAVRATVCCFTKEQKPCLPTMEGGGDAESCAVNSFFGALRRWRYWQCSVLAAASRQDEDSLTSGQVQGCLSAASGERQHTWRTSVALVSSIGVPFRVPVSNGTTALFLEQARYAKRTRACQSRSQISHSVVARGTR